MSAPRLRPGGTPALLLRPPAAPLLALAFAARTVAAVLPITLLLALADRYGYARAALVGGSHTLVLAFLVPLRGRLLDRYGHRNALPVMAVVAMTLTTVAAVSVTARWPWWTTLLLVITASMSGPPLNAALRSSWRRLVAPTHLKAVHTADSVLEEAGFVAAPLAAGTAVTLLDEVTAYQTAAACYLLTMALYLAAARHWGLAHTRPPAPAERSRAARRAHRWLGPLAQPRILMIMLPLLVMGCLFGGTGIYVPAYSQAHHATAQIGPLLAAISAGGVLGGLLYAALPTRRLPPWTLYRLLTAGFALPGCFLLFARPPLLLAALLLLSGLFVTPLFITAFLLLDATATDDVRTEANTWVGASTDISNGITAIAIGALTAGQHFHTALTVLSACAACGILTALLLPSPPPPPEKAPNDTPQPGPGREVPAGS
ncbi:MFS transporter [Streptomyces sp. ISL-12]|uniref:MFS transporter n=1 Tax=Streptomyces sp. ISL-12 TaxID=2819177 RepID=UPI001BEC444E|nr:MFS transporter [Streptomyces sp. ISL-12]MBT2411119.1 MFS transporter [Streptomyces sp. ISL-12]